MIIRSDTGVDVMNKGYSSVPIYPMLDTKHSNLLFHMTVLIQLQYFIL